jgi:hypothetical protein
MSESFGMRKIANVRRTIPRADLGIIDNKSESSTLRTTETFVPRREVVWSVLVVRHKR